MLQERTALTPQGMAFKKAQVAPVDSLTSCGEQSSATFVEAWSVGSAQKTGFRLMWLTNWMAMTMKGVACQRSTRVIHTTDDGQCFLDARAARFVDNTF